MGGTANSAAYTIKGTIIGVLHLNIMTVLLPPVKEEDG